MSDIRDMMRFRRRVLDKMGLGPPYLIGTNEKDGMSQHDFEIDWYDRNRSLLATLDHMIACEVVQT